eukprot:gene22742-28428_t
MFSTILPTLCLVAVPVLMLSAQSPAPPPLCQQQLDAWCNLPSSCAIKGKSDDPKDNKTCSGHFRALFSGGDPTRPSQLKPAYRCFDEVDLLSTAGAAPGSTTKAAYKYKGFGSCYCTREEQLEYHACLCENSGDKSKCGNPPPPPPSPPLPPPNRPTLHFTHVITANDQIGSCYRNPVLTLLDDNTTLLCFIEERSRGVHWKPGETGDHACPDNYEGHAGGHNLGFMKSTDLGATW